VQISRKWEYEIDNEFAITLFRSSSWNFPSQRPLPNELCATYNRIFNDRGRESVAKFRRVADNCQFCTLLLSALKQVDNLSNFQQRYTSDSDLSDPTEEVYIHIKGSAVKIVKGPRLLRICSDLGLKYLITLSISNTNSY